MKIFVTGATGWVGLAVVRELIGSGHKVLGLTRSDGGDKVLSTAGAEVLRGSLEDLESLRKGGAAADGVIHTAFIHDFSKMEESSRVDRRAIETIGAVLEGSQHPLVITAGIALLAPGKLATEEDAPPTVSPSYPRASEAAAASIAARGVKVSVVRLPPSVHGKGDHGLVAMLVDIARRTGMSAYVGDGSNRWAAVNRFDAARAYRLAIEHGASAPRYHAVAEEGVAFKKIAEAIGRGLKLPVVAKSREEAATHFGWLGMFAGMDVSASSALTREQLGWAPKETGLIADIEKSGYCG